ALFLSTLNGSATCHGSSTLTRPCSSTNGKVWTTSIAQLTNTTCPKNGLVVVETLNFSFANLDMDLMSLAGLIIGFRFLAYLALLSKTYRSY
ncbi:unnamed protein product, partial [Timema podura]|nr:unnamed protein product [Timema podura]